MNKKVTKYDHIETNLPSYRKGLTKKFVKALYGKYDLVVFKMRKFDSLLNDDKYYYATQTLYTYSTKSKASAFSLAKRFKTQGRSVCFIRADEYDLYANFKVSVKDVHALQDYQSEQRFKKTSSPEYAEVHKKMKNFLDSLGRKSYASTKDREVQ